MYRAQARPVTLDAVQAALPPGAALVEIAVYRPFNNRVAQRDKRFGAARYVAYVVRPGAQPASVDLGDVTAIDAQVESLRRALSNTKSAGSRSRGHRSSWQRRPAASAAAWRVPRGSSSRPTAR